MIPRKAQTTAFTIAALAIIVVAIAITSLSQRSNLPQTEIPQALTLPPKAQAVHDLMSACLSSASEESILAMASQGGYYLLPQRVLQTEIASYPLYVTGTVATTPTLQDVENNLGAYIRRDAPNCIQESKTKIAGVEITPTAPPKPIIQITEGRVAVKIQYPLSLVFDGTTIEVTQPYAYALPINLFTLYNSAVRIAQATAASPEQISLDTLLEGNLQSQVTSYKNTLIYTLSEPNSKIKELPIVFMFAVEVPQ